MNTIDSTLSDVSDNNSNGTGIDWDTNRPEVPTPPIDGEQQVHVMVNNIIVSFLSLLTVLAHIPVLMVLLRCCRMPTSLKLLSINFVLCSLLYFASIVVTSIIFLSLTEAYTQTVSELRVMFAFSLYTSNICAVGGLALERFVRIIYPLFSSQILQTRYIIAYIVGACMIGFLSSVIPFISQCDLKLQLCNISQALYINRYILITIFCGFSILIWFSCLKIFKVINSNQICPYNQIFIPSERVDINPNNVQEPNHSSQTQNYRSGFRATRYIIKIMITYVICHIPFLINSSILLPFPNLKATQIVAILQMLSFVCSLVNFFISTHFFIWKFKESKLVFLQLFCSWNPRLSTKTRDLKMDVYNIPIATRENVVDVSANHRNSSFNEA